MDTNRTVTHTPSGACPHPACTAHDLEVTSLHGLEELLRLHAEGASPTTIAAALNRAGFRTPRGLRWHRVSVGQVIGGDRSTR